MAGRVKRSETEKQTIQVLVAEDDPFQRIALIDLLTICGFEVNACENGLKARDELLKNEQEFDLILLDLKMPEMDGLELLKIIKQIEKLKTIPVLMMSCEGQNNIVGACISAGAADYLVKPVNLKKLQTLNEYVKKKPKQGKQNDNEKACYTVVKNLGRGACGSVDLVKRDSDQQLFAMKTIPIYYMSEIEKRNAENEVSLLKVLTAPTIIRYYESIIDKDQINIIMEYAEGGSLHDKIQQHIKNGTKIEKDQILYWFSQLIIAIQFMHSKNILHRDIKTQNMFLKSIFNKIFLDNIIKLGDFGISKALGTHNDFAKTFLGTPYFMPPEVIKGDQYGVRADIWALGCALYELVMFKRPFQHDAMQIVFEMIINKPYELSTDVDRDIAVLLEKMLNKDPNKRPSIWDLAKLPIIEEKINQFYAEHPDEANQFIKLNQDKNEQSTTIEEDNPMQILFEMSQSLKPSILTQGLIRQVKYVGYSGQEIYDWIKKCNPKKNPQEVIQLLMDNCKFKSITGQTTIINSINAFYCFSFIHPSIPANAIQQYKGASQDLDEILNKIFKRFKLFQKKVTKQKQILKDQMILCIKEYLDILHTTWELQKATMIDYSNADKFCSFLNLYHIMRFHKAVQQYYIQHFRSQAQQRNQHFLGKVIQLFTGVSDFEADFSYIIGGLSYTIDEIKHGILRNNKSGGSFSQWPVGENRNVGIDIKGIFTIFKEEFSQENPITYEIELVEKDQVQKFLMSKIKQFMKQYVCIDIYDNELIIHPIIQNYLNDFNKSNRNMLEWVLENMDKVQNKTQILKQFDQQEFYFRFKDPNL